MKACFCLKKNRSRNLFPSPVLFPQSSLHFSLSQRQSVTENIFIEEKLKIEMKSQTRVQVLSNLAFYLQLFGNLFQNVIWGMEERERERERENETKYNISKNE